MYLYRYKRIKSVYISVHGWLFITYLSAAIVAMSASVDLLGAKSKRRADGEMENMKMTYKYTLAHLYTVIMITIIHTCIEVYTTRL